jgi:diaminopimelate decarboxylase
MPVSTPHNGFAYVDGDLRAEGLALSRIAATVGTPFYCYSRQALTSGYTGLASALSHLPAMICFAVKANSNLAVISTFAQLGAGADVVSEGELRRALAAGVPPERIVFSGVGKTEDELRFAIEADVGQINVESEPELEALNGIASALGRTARISFRVNPDVDAQTHDKISTGRRQDKFGIALAKIPDIYARAAAMAGVTPVGVAVHIGSQLLDLAPYRAAFERVATLVTDLRTEGHTVDRVDLGGGIGIRYRDEEAIDFQAYADLVTEIFDGLDCQLIFEPGRSLVGNAGILVSTVLYVKEGEERPIVVVDAAMNDLKRPAMYGAYHEIAPVRQAPAETAERAVDVVGPICETGDTFAIRRKMPPVTAGDLLVFGSAGAYGAVMASQYNSRLLAPEVMVDGDKYAVVRARPSYDDMLAMEHVPAWLTRGGAESSTTEEAAKGAETATRGAA